MVVGTQKRGGSLKQNRPRTSNNFRALHVNNYVQAHDTFTIRFPWLQFPYVYITCQHMNSSAAAMLKRFFMRGAFDMIPDCTTWIKNQRALIIYRHSTDQTSAPTQPRTTNPEGGGCKWHQKQNRKSTSRKPDYKLPQDENRFRYTNQRTAATRFFQFNAKMFGPLSASLCDLD